MPEMINYVVSQTREVKVTANSLEDAIRIAGVAFTHGQNSDHGIKSSDYPDDMKGVWGNTRTKVREIEISGREGY
jgi:hypothetical protein